MDIRTATDTDAQRAFRRMLDNHLRTGEWSPPLVAEYLTAERSLDELSDPELDALFEATQADIEDLRVLGDIPLAVLPFAWTPAEAVLPESELRALFGDR